MSPARRCSRTACGRPAVNTLTYVYADRRPCWARSRRTPSRTPTTSATPTASGSAPRAAGRSAAGPGPALAGPTSDDLLALADAVREAARPVPARVPLGAVDEQGPDDGRVGTRRGHLRVLTD